jgi:hypothetical protein
MAIYFTVVPENFLQLLIHICCQMLCVLFQFIYKIFTEVFPNYYLLTFIVILIDEVSVALKSMSFKLGTI